MSSDSQLPHTKNETLLRLCSVVQQMKLKAKMSYYVTLLVGDYNGGGGPRHSLTEIRLNQVPKRKLVQIMNV